MFDTDNTENQIPRSLRRRLILWNADWPIIFLVVVWGLYALARCGIEIRSLRRIRINWENDPGEQAALLWIAVIVTPISLLWGYLAVKRAIHLARCGVVVEATITRIGGTTWHWSRIDYEYELNGVRVRKATSVSRDEANEYLNGQKPLLLVCDPAKPKRSVLREKIWPDEPPEYFDDELPDVDDELPGGQQPSL